MIPKMSFPSDKLQLVTLYRDEAELKKAKETSDAKGAMSKVSKAYHELYFPAPSDDRPYTFSSIVLSLDGKMAFPDNPQGPVVASANYIDCEGSVADFWVLNVLRAHADAIVVGAKTMKCEPNVVFACFDPDLLPDRKEKLGKEAEIPLTVIVSLDGKDIPLNHSLFDIKEIHVLIATCHEGGNYLKEQYGQAAMLIGPFYDKQKVDGVTTAKQIDAGLKSGKKVILMTGENEPNSEVLLYILRKMGVRHLLSESPTYTWLLMSQKLLDELFVNYSSLFIGGSISPGYGIGFSYLNHPHSKFLVIAMHQNSFLFTRQKLVYDLKAC